MFKLAFEVALISSVLLISPWRATAVIIDVNPVNPWTDLNFQVKNDGNPDHFQFAVWGDPHYASGSSYSDQPELKSYLKNVLSELFDLATLFHVRVSKT